MSEFKYACPVCGQHISCDSSQAGSVMECPTCFQKITVPQAPAYGDQKYILTGSKVTDRKIPHSAEGRRGGVAPKKSPVAAVTFGILLTFLAVGAAVYFSTGKQAGGNPFGSQSGAPSPWQAGDIGGVGAAGSFKESQGEVTIAGSGADIWHRADGFYFVSQPLNGNGSLAAQVLDLKNTDEWAKTGVMIRETTNASSVFVLASARADGQAQSIWRSATGAEAEASSLAGGQGYPKWVKILRQGNRFSAFFKVNEQGDWLPLGAPLTLQMSPEALIGLAVCSHNDGTLSEARLAQINFEAEAKSGTNPAASSAETMIAPVANDTNWTLNLEAVTNVEATPAMGRVHGQDFLCGEAVLQGGLLTLHGAEHLSIAINFGGVQAAALAGTSIHISTNAQSAAQVTLRWREGGKMATDNFENGYAMRLEFGALENRHITGKIYFCAPDDMKSYIVGTFSAEIRKPKTPKPAPPMQ